MEQAGTTSVKVYGVIASSDIFPAVWAEAAPLLQLAVERTQGRISMERVLAEVINRNMQLWIALDTNVVAAALTRIVKHEQSKVFRVEYVGGTRMCDWQWYLAELERFGYEHGCDEIEIEGRIGWVRQLKDYDMRSVTLTKPLRHRDENLH